MSTLRSLSRPVVVVVVVVVMYSDTRNARNVQKKENTQCWNGFTNRNIIRLRKTVTPNGHRSEGGAKHLRPSFTAVHLNCLLSSYFDDSDICTIIHTIFWCLLQVLSLLASPSPCAPSIRHRCMQTAENSLNLISNRFFDNFSTLLQFEIDLLR